MTLEMVRQLLRAQASFGGSYNRTSAKMVLAGVQREHGRAAADKLIRELGLDDVFGFEPGQPIET